MPSAGGLIAARLQLTGGAQFAAGMERGAVATQQLGAAATATAAETRAASAGISTMNASAATGVGAMARLKSAGTRASSVGRSIGSTFGLAFGVLAVGSIKMSRDFWGSMRLVQTSAGASEEEMKSLGNSILDLAKSREVTQGPKELSEGLYSIVSAGYRGKRAMDVLRASAQLAMASQSELGATTKALTGALNTGVKGTETLDSTIAALNATVGGGNMTMSDLTSALSSGLLVSAKGVGVGIDSVGGALDVLTSRGMTASKAANNLSTTLKKMATPSTAGAKAMESIGLSQYAMAKEMRGPGGLPAAVGLLNAKMKGLSQDQKGRIITDLFGTRSATVFQTLLQNMGDLDRLTKGIGNGTGKLKADLKDINEAKGTQLNKAFTALKAQMISLGDILLPILLPPLTTLVGILGKIVGVFGKLPKPIQFGAIAFLTLIAVAGPVLIFIGAVISAITFLAPAVGVLGAAFTFLMGPVGLVILAVAALGIGFYIAYKKVGWFRDGVDAVFKWLKGAVLTVVNFVKDHWKLLVGFIAGPLVGITLVVIHNWGRIKGATKAAWNWVKKTISSAVRAVINFVRGHWKLIVGILAGPLGAAVVIISSHWSSIKNGAASVWSAVKSAFSKIISFIASVPGKIGSSAHGMWDGIKEAFRSAINWIINAWNSLHFTIPSVKAFGKTIGGGTVSVPQIPQLATGGFITGAGMALVGEAGPELLHLPRGAAVEPLSTPRVGIPSRTGERRLAATRGTQDTIVPVTIQLDRRTIATAVARASEDSAARQ